LAENLNAAVINAGDGCRSHPTQALLDMFTIKERLGEIKGKKIAIIGDILHSRVARSNIWGLTKMGAQVTVCGPSTLMPIGIEKLGVKMTYHLDDVLADSDVLMLLRIQLERQQDKFLPSLREYSRLYQVNDARMAKANPGAPVLHPGPMNEGVEISAALAHSTSSLIEEQVQNGVAVRMALLYLMRGSK